MYLKSPFKKMVDVPVSDGFSGVQLVLEPSKSHEHACQISSFPPKKMGWKMTRVWNTNNLVSHKALIRKFNKELFRFILTPYHPYIPPSIELTWVLNKPLEVNLKQRCRAEGLGWLQGWKMHKSPQVVAIYIMQWFFLVNLAWWHKIFQKQTMCVQKQHHPTWPTSPQTKSF